MTAILGRMAAYSGKLVTWDEAVKSDLAYAPDRIAWDAAPRSKPGADGIYPCAMPGITKASVIVAELAHGGTEATGMDPRIPRIQRFDGESASQPQSLLIAVDSGLTA